MNMILVFVGGGAGALARYAVSAMLAGRTGGLPGGTMTVNLVGCFLIGIAAGFMERQGMDRRVWLLVVTGFMGGFTTFSTFSLETVEAMRGAMAGRALLVVAVNLAGGLAATVAGLGLAGKAR